MDETLTPAGLLREVAVRGTEMAISAPTTDERDACLAGADALDRLAQTCATCQHANMENIRDGWCFCAAPHEMCDTSSDPAVRSERWPFKYHAMPLDERCKGWTKREDAP